MFTGRFDGQSRLLVRALLSGVHGALRALEVFHKQQRANSDTSLKRFVETLCQNEVTCLVSETQLLTVKPLVCLFPCLFKQNLLAFIYHVHHILPQTTIRPLVECLKQDLPPSMWITALITQLQRQLDVDNEKPLFSAPCRQRLLDLSQLVDRSGNTAGWASCFQTLQSSTAESTSSEVAIHRKRKISGVSQDSDSEKAGPQNKRFKVDVCCGSVNTEQGQGKKEELLAHAGTAEVSQTNVPWKTLPENIKITVLQIKELLQSNSEWDQSLSDVVQVLNECDPAQVEVVCSTLNLPNLPEQTLPKLCSSVLAFSPDLSFSTVTTFIKSLLLDKVLSLSEPASRCLVSAVTSLCTRYPRPVCHALFEHVLEDTSIGTLQADLLNKLVEGCLDSHYKLLALQMTLKIQWNEAVLTIIHCLLDSKLDLNEDLFTQFILQLKSQASHFTKSVKFAKMLLTVLTKYSSNVTAAHKQTLSSCLMLNDTFLKKSLQGALKRITHI